MNHTLKLVALAAALLLPACAHAQQGGAALVGPLSVTQDNCAKWDDTVNVLGDSGIGCANHQMTISDGAHGSMLFSPTNILLPNSPSILNTTPGQPLLMMRGVATTGTDGVDIDIRRYGNYTGGTHGFVNAAVRVYGEISAGTKAFEWPLLCVLNNSAAVGDTTENSCGYFQAHKINGGATWALTAELLDHQADPNSPSVTLEFDLQSKGTDVHSSRVIQDLWAKSDDGLATVVSYGMRFNTDAHSTIGTGITMNGSYGNGINLSAGSYLSAAIVLADNQKICTTALCATYLMHSAGVTYLGSSGGNLVSFSDAGAITGVSVNAATAMYLNANSPVCFDSATCSKKLYYDSSANKWTFNNTSVGAVATIDSGGNISALGLISTFGSMTAGGTVTAPTLALSSGNALTMSGSTMVMNVGGATRLSLSTGGVIGAQVGGAFAVGFSTGVSCSGINAATVVVSGGIVTHC